MNSTAHATRGTLTAAIGAVIVLAPAADALAAERTTTFSASAMVLATAQRGPAADQNAVAPAAATSTRPKATVTVRCVAGKKSTTATTGRATRTAARTATCRPMR